MFTTSNFKKGKTIESGLVFRQLELLIARFDSLVIFDVPQSFELVLFPLRVAKRIGVEVLPFSI